MKPKITSLGLEEVRKFIKEVRKGIKPAIIAAMIIICLITTWSGYLQGAPYPIFVLGTVIFLVTLIYALKMAAKIDQHRKTW